MMVNVGKYTNPMDPMDNYAWNLTKIPKHSLFPNFQQPIANQQLIISCFM